MGVNRGLLAEFLREYPFQPATAFWRAVEVGEVLRLGVPEGLGLDLGCGDGKLTAVLLRSAGRRAMVGVDVDGAETAMASRHDFYERIHTVSAGRIPEGDATFDFVFSNSVLEHIEEVDPVLEEACRVLKAGGRFVFTVPGPGFREALKGPLLPWLRREEYLAALDERLAHKRYWGEAEWARRLAPHGVAIERAVAYMTPGEVRRWETLARFTAGVLCGLFAAAGRRRRPIDIQRTLGMRSGGLRLPASVAEALSGLFTWNIGGGDEVRPAGCLLVSARKR